MYIINLPILSEQDISRESNGHSEVQNSLGMYETRIVTAVFKTERQSRHSIPLHKTLFL
jgi:hypothetical protein